MCDHILDVLVENIFIRISDHHVLPSMQGQMFCKLHNSFKHSTKDCNMFRQIVQSAIDKGRLSFAETHVNDQLNSIGLDGNNLLNRLLQTDSFKGEKVSTGEDGLKPSSETRDIAEVHVEDILVGEKSIQVASETSSTGGQQGDAKIDACKIKEDKGHDKHKGKKSKVTFEQLLAKY
jgi:hypothetical protein